MPCNPEFTEVTTPDEANILFAKGYRLACVYPANKELQKYTGENHNFHYVLYSCPTQLGCSCP